MAAWEIVVETLKVILADSGFDLVKPFRISQYNDQVDARYAMPDFGNPSSLAVLIGNTAVLWPHFLKAVRQAPALYTCEDPLDLYVERTIGKAVKDMGHPWELRYVHEPAARRIAMQQMAHGCGLAHLGPAHLTIHEEVGPWMALRACVVFDMEGPIASISAPDPCTPCAKPCLPALNRAVSRAKLQCDAQTWRVWVDVRDACPMGRNHRYSDDQVRYHYSKDKNVLPLLPSARSK